MPTRTPLDALDLVLSSVEVARNGRAFGLLLGTFAVGGLLVAMAESAAARGQTAWAALQAGLALFAAFYGGNAAGILVMEEARGRPVPEIADALAAALRRAHRLLLTLALLAAGYALIGGVLLGLLWLCRTAVTGPTLGALLFGLAMPLGVVTVGLALLSVLAVVVPLAAPAVWAGLPVLATVRLLAGLMRRRLLTAALLSTALSLLVAAVGALVSFAVIAGGKALAWLAIEVVGLQVPTELLTAGLFGIGLRSFGASAAAAAVADSPGQVAAALVGNGVVFAVALVLPGLVWLRGACGLYLALSEPDEAPAAG